MANETYDYGKIVFSNGRWINSKTKKEVNSPFAQQSQYADGGRDSKILPNYGENFNNLSLNNNLNHFYVIIISGMIISGIIIKPCPREASEVAENLLREIVLFAPRADPVARPHVLRDDTRIWSGITAHLNPHPTFR